MIEIQIHKGTPSGKWAAVANKKARAEAEKQGIAWVDAQVFVSLPEHGRCMTKDAGFTQLVTHG